MIRELFRLSEEQFEFIDKLPEKGTAIFRDRRFDRPYLVQIPGDLDIKPITLDETDQIMSPFIERLHDQSAVVEGHEPKPIDLNRIERNAFNQAIGVIILKSLKKDIRLTYTQLLTTVRNRYGFAKGDIDSAIDWLKKQELINRIKCRSSKTKDAWHFPLTKKSQISLNIPEAEQVAPSRFKHTLYCNQVKRWLKRQGHTAIKEFSLTAEHSTEGERIDVFSVQNGKKVAYEITLTLNTSDVMVNVKKCLYFFKVDQLFIVCERQDPEIIRAMEIISNKVPDHMLEKIGFLSMSHFF